MHRGRQASASPSRSAALLAAGVPSPDAMRVLQRSVGNAAVGAARSASPVVQRASAYYVQNQNDTTSKVLAKSLRERYGLSSSPSKVKRGEILWIIGHGSEVGNGTEVARRVMAEGFVPGNGKRVRLVVCKAGKREADAHAAPAQNIANILQTPVEGSTSWVWHTGSAKSDIIEGRFMTFRPQGPVEDITSRMGHLRASDVGPVDRLTHDMGYLSMATNGYSSHNARGGGHSFGGTSEGTYDEDVPMEGYTSGSFARTGSSRYHY